MLEFDWSMVRFRDVTRRFFARPTEHLADSVARKHEAQNHIRLSFSVTGFGCDGPKYKARNVPAKVEARSYYDCQPAAYPEDGYATAAAFIDDGFQGGCE
jgi:hypothetical protein